MLTVKTIPELNAILDLLRAKGNSIGFVPTMGALHFGHLQLMKKAKEETSIVVVSIFVNPTQFNNSNDLSNYPRMLQKDEIMCEEVGVDVIFAPEVQEMYPIPDKRVFEFGLLDKVMEGKHRPGHFNGVAQVVSKLFDSVKPNKAYFGQKDFQQLAVIKRLVKDFNYNIDIVACPTVRETDGLAMSSRNMLLTQQQRASAPLIAKTLHSARNNKGRFSVKEMIAWVVTEINSNPLFVVEYFEIANAETLEAVENWNDSNHLVGCIAVQVGEVRLIDNILF
jgi:pantoate--beta-alanine ligase